MADVKLLREGLAANLTTLPDIQVSAYMLSSPTPPAAHVVTGPVAYDMAMGRGLDDLTFRVQVFVGLVSDIGAQQNLDAYLAGSGALSVKQALESDKTLGGAAFGLQVTESTGPQMFTGDSGPVLMAEWTVLVKAKGA